MTVRQLAKCIPVPLKYTGSLLIILLPFAWTIQEFSELPSSYSWCKTLELFTSAITDKYFIVMAFIVLLAEGWISESNPLSFHTGKLFDRLRIKNIWIVSFVMYRSSHELSQIIQRLFNGSPKQIVSFIFAVIFSVCPLLTLAFLSSNYTKWDFLLLPVVAIMLFRTLYKRHLGYALLAMIATLLLLMIVSYVFTIFKSQLFVAGVVLDSQIVAAEKALFGYPLYAVIAQWAAGHIEIVRFSDWVYYLFFHHIVLVALFLFSIGDSREQLRYSTCLSLCYLLGGGIYFFFPALGPVFFDLASFDYLKEGAPQTVYFQDMLWRSTQESIHGHLEKIEPYAFIACMPSLHMAHETIMLFYSRHSLIMLLFSGLFWISSFIAVLVLGWHYFFDVIAGSVFACLIVGFVQFYKAKIATY
jgi:hypothetical protein